MKVPLKFQVDIYQERLDLSYGKRTHLLFVSISKQIAQINCWN